MKKFSFFLTLVQLFGCVVTSNAQKTEKTNKQKRYETISYFCSNGVCPFDGNAGSSSRKADSAAIAAADSIRQAELTSTIQDIVRQEMNHYDSNS